MARDNAELSGQLVEQGGKNTSLAIQGQLDKWKSQHFEKLSALVGSKEEADKVFVICMNTIGKNPKLMDCSFSTIANCILQSCQLKLFPGPFAECAYVPLNNRRTGQLEANFWPQYQGIVKLLRNAGNQMIVARVVRENDFFEYSEGSNAPKYAPAVVMGKKRGKRLFVYAAVCTSHNMWQVEVMSEEQINTIKARSPGSKMGDSPWNSKYEDDVDAMWAKTALKRVSKFCTKSAELVQAIEFDNEVDGDPSFIKTTVVDLANTGANDRMPLAAPEGNGEALGIEAPVGGVEINLGQRETAVVK